MFLKIEVAMKNVEQFNRRKDDLKPVEVVVANRSNKPLEKTKETLEQLKVIMSLVKDVVLETKEVVIALAMIAVFVFGLYEVYSKALSHSPNVPQSASTSRLAATESKTSSEYVE